MGNSLQSVTGGALATGLGALAMLRAAAEDTVAAFDPLHVTGADGPPADPFDARDPEYIRATLPALRTMSDIYFRADVSGLQRIPESGPVLLVGNHSGGHDDRRHLRLRAVLLRPLRARPPVPPAGARPRVPSPRPAHARAALRNRARLALQHAPARSIGTPPCWSTRAGTRRASGRPGRRARSASPAGRGSSSWRWSATSRSFPVVALGGQETGLFLGRGRRVAARLVARPARPAQGPPTGARPPGRGDAARLPHPRADPGEDRDPGHAADRPARAARAARRTSTTDTASSRAGCSERSPGSRPSGRCPSSASPPRPAPASGSTRAGRVAHAGVDARLVRPGAALAEARRADDAQDAGAVGRTSGRPSRPGRCPRRPAGSRRRPSSLGSKSL